MTVAGEPAQAPPAPPTAPAPTADDARRVRLSFTPELNGIRGLALLIVLVHHLGVLMWPDKPSWFFPGGQTGLDLFFALSGFLITVILLGEHGRTGGVRIANFLWRRLLRLGPALIALMAALTVAAVATDRYTPRQMLSSSAWVLTFATNIGVDKVIVEVGHTWSLSVEAHFYLVWGVVVAGVAAVVRRPYAVLAAVAAVGIVVVGVARAAAFVDDGGVTAFDLYVATIYRIDAPLVGALAGVAWVAGWLNRVPPKAAAWVAGLALAGLALATVKTTPLSPVLYQGLFTAVAACGAALVVAAQLSGPGWARRALALRPLVLTGTISYSLYLWHLPVMMYVNRNATAWPLALRMAMALVVTWVLSALSYRFVERPFLRKKAKAAA